MQYAFGGKHEVGLIDNIAVIKGGPAIAQYAFGGKV